MKKNKIEQLAEAVENLRRENAKTKNKHKFKKKKDWKQFRANINKGEKDKWAITHLLIFAIERCEILEKQLEIAVKTLEFYEKPFACFHPEYNIAQHHNKAVEALAKIKELDRWKRKQLQ